MKKSSLLLGVGATLILALCACLAWRFFAPGFVELTFVDSTTQQPLAGVTVHLSQDRWLPFPVRQLLMDYTGTARYDAVTNERGSIHVNVRQRNTVFVKAFAEGTEKSDVYEPVYQLADANKAATIILTRKVDQ